MHYLYGSINRGHAICPLYGGCPLFGESAIRGFTVYVLYISFNYKYMFGRCLSALCGNK